MSRNFIFFVTFYQLISNQALARVLDVYSQNVYFNQADNFISQTSIKYVRPIKNFETYLGVYIDTDTKSGSSEIYTDKQVSPFFGLQSKLLSRTIPFRFFGQIYSVNRLAPLPKSRTKHLTEYRVGALAYDLIETKNLFHEYYGAIIYSHIYEQKVIYQGWYKLGKNIEKTFDAFLELNLDSFNLNQNEESTLDFRPGLRKDFKFKNSKLSLIGNYLLPINNENQEQEFRASIIFSSQYQL